MKPEKTDIDKSKTLRDLEPESIVLERGISNMGCKNFTVEEVDSGHDTLQVLACTLELEGKLGKTRNGRDMQRRGPCGLVTERPLGMELDVKEFETGQHSSGRSHALESNYLSPFKSSRLLKFWDIPKAKRNKVSENRENTVE